MLGNVMEYCADKYDPEAYAKSGSSATDPLITEGTEWVVRGGNYTPMRQIFAALPVIIPNMKLG